MKLQIILVFYKIFMGVCAPPPILGKGQPMQAPNHEHYIHS